MPCPRNKKYTQFSERDTHPVRKFHVSGSTVRFFRRNYESSLFNVHSSEEVTEVPKASLALRKKCPYSELFWSVISRIRTEYKEILRISPCSVRIRENTDQINPEYGHILHSLGRPLMIGKLLTKQVQEYVHILLGKRWYCQ